MFECAAEQEESYRSFRHVMEGGTGSRGLYFGNIAIVEYLIRGCLTGEGQYFGRNSSENESQAMPCRDFH